MNKLFEFRLGDYRGAILLVFFFVIALEAFLSWKKDLRNYNLKETASNVIILIGLQLSKFLFASYQLWMLHLFSTMAFFHISKNWLTFLLAFIVVDFLFYWYHFLSHRFKLLWAFHLIHHSSPWMNLTTAYRLNWLGVLISPIFFLLAVIIGFAPSTVAVCIAINLVYQFFLHTELVSKLGWLEKFLNTPSNHRVHHGSNVKYIDKNFGGFLIIWDRLFGTYQEEEEKPIYGITTGFVSHNPIVLVFHGFVDLLRGKMNSKG
ncbi:MAG: sterol desaturase family protein [Cyclobacteriaceae bacterium]